MQSGELGLEAFLPPRERQARFQHASPVADERDPFLPLASSWTKVDFTMGKVLAPWARAVDIPADGVNGEWRAAEVNVREWVMRAMARYRFVIGELARWIALYWWRILILASFQVIRRSTSPS